MTTRQYLQRSVGEADQSVVFMYTLGTHCRKADVDDFVWLKDSAS